MTMTMTFEAPAAMAGQEVPVLAVFDGEEATTVQEVEAVAVEPIADGDGLSTAELLPSEEWAAGTVEPANATSEDDTFFEELELLGKLAKAERYRQEASQEYLDQKESLKLAKDLLSSAEIRVHQVASDIANFMAGKAMPTKSPELTTGSPGITAEAVDDSWRKISTRDLLAGVKGLGAKKLDALCDLCKTAGELEDLRATSNGVFKTVLPSGFGDKVASAIEDALLEAAKPSAGRAADQVEPRAEKNEDDGEFDFDPLPVFGQLDVTADKIAATVLWDDLRKKIERENELSTYTLLDCELDGDDSVQFEEGFNAFEDNEAVHFCDADTYEGQVDWVMGWCVAKQKERLLSEAESEAEADEAEADDSISDL